MTPAPLRRFAKLVAGSTFLLLLAGGMVTSTGSGLAVPDWPLSYGQWMPAMEGGVLYEHGHRMIAGLVGLMIAVLAFWLWRREPRAWVRRLGWLALAGVVLQALLGGATVLLELPDAVSIAHAGLAELVFGLTVAIAIACSRGWHERRERLVDAGEPALLTLASITAVAVFLQILLGAVVRHTGAGMAIPTFPLAYGQLVPPLDSQPVALHFAHRAGAVVVLVLIAWLVRRVWRSHRRDPWLLKPALLLAGLVVLQIGLGGWVIWSYKAAWVTTAHLGVGALLWAGTVGLALKAGRGLRLAPLPAAGPAGDLVVQAIT
ncbi:MAG: COX15/CtaA family protein [Gemmatimonadota bacterium]